MRPPQHLRQSLAEAWVVLLSLLITFTGKIYKASAGLVQPALRWLAKRYPGAGFSSGPPLKMVLPHLPTIEVITPLVTRVLGLNPGAHTLQGTCTYLVGKGRKRILIDTGEGRQGYVKEVKKALAQAGADGIETVLLTHDHYDHTGGLDDIRREFGARIPTFKRLDNCGSGGLSNVQHADDSHVFSTEGATLRTIYTPGHTEDHVCFWLEEEGALFSADCILGHGTTVFDDLHDYMASLRLLLRMAKGGESADGGPVLQRIYPGHGAPILENPTSVIETYIEHRNLREAQVLQSLQQAESERDKGLSSLQIVHLIYQDLPPAVVMSAQWNVEHHLNKLQREGRVMKDGCLGRWRIADDKSS